MSSEQGGGDWQGQGCKKVIMCQELFLWRLSIEMTGSRQFVVTNLNLNGTRLARRCWPEPWR